MKLLFVKSENIFHIFANSKTKHIKHVSTQRKYKAGNHSTID